MERICEYVHILIEATVIPTVSADQTSYRTHQALRDERPQISHTTMDESRKRSFESSELLEQDDISRYERGRQMNIGEAGDSAIRNELPISSLDPSADERAEIPSNEAGSDSDADKGKDTRNERRLEVNRQRAKDIRKRKKQMIEEMQKQIILLTIENNKLRAQNQMQRAELTLLHNSLKPILPNQQVSFPNRYKMFRQLNEEGLSIVLKCNFCIISVFSRQVFSH